MAEKKHGDAVPVVSGAIEGNSLAEIVDDFDALVDNAQAGIIELLRLEPPTDYNGVRIRGFLQNLPPGSTKQWIKDTYGGGRYRIIQRDSAKRIVKSTDLEVAGSPVPASVPVQRKDAAGDPSLSETILPAPAGPPTVNVQGVPLGVDMQTFWLYLLQATIAERMLSRRELDPMKILEIMTRQQTMQAGGVGDQIKATRELMEFVREMSLAEPVEGDGSPDYIALLTNLLGALANKAGAPAARRPVIGESVGKEIRKPSLPGPAAISAAPETGTVESDERSMDKNMLLQTAINQIVAGFSLNPPKEPDRLIAVLKMNIPPLPVVIEAITPMREQIFDQIEMQLADLFGELPEKRTEFADYFAKVFDGYIR